MELRKTEKSEIPAVMDIISDSIAGLKAAGINQWQQGYPNAKSIENDIDQGWSYVLVQENEILAT